MHRYVKYIKLLHPFFLVIVLLGPHNIWFMSAMGLVALSCLAVTLHYESGMPWRKVAWLLPAIAVAIPAILVSLLYLGATNYWLFGAFCVLLVVAVFWLERRLGQKRRKNV